MLAAVDPRDSDAQYEMHFYMFVVRYQSINQLIHLLSVYLWPRWQSVISFTFRKNVLRIKKFIPHNHPIMNPASH